MNNAEKNFMVFEKREALDSDRKKLIFIPGRREGDKVKFIAKRKKRQITLMKDSKAICIKTKEYNLSFSKNLADGKIFDFEVNRCGIQLFFLNNVSEGCCFSEYCDQINSPYKKSVIAKNILPGIDLEYIIEMGKIKENVIVNSRSADYKYKFTYKMKDLRAVMFPGANKLDFMLVGTYCSQFYIPVPFMYDSAGAYSDAVYYEIEMVAPDIVNVTLIADRNWINDSNRVLPITIDPVMVLNKVL